MLWNICPEYLGLIQLLVSRQVAFSDRSSITKLITEGGGCLL